MEEIQAYLNATYPVKDKPWDKLNAFFLSELTENTP